MFGTFHPWECYFIIQVQSYNLNREHYRRNVALEIRNKKGKLSNLNFRNKKELGTIFVYKKRNNTISQKLGELGTKEKELD